MAIANQKSKIENAVVFCLLLASACAPTPAPVQPPAERIAATLGPAAPKEVLWDGFEEGNRWTVEAADDPANLRVSPERATEERVALKVDFEAAGRGKVHLRRETRLDITEMTKFKCDVWCSAEGLSLALAFRTTSALTYYQSQATPLGKDWNRNIEFDLTMPQFKPAERGGAAFDSLLNGKDDVRRVSLVIIEGPNKRGTLFFDNLRFVGPPSTDWEKIDPQIVAVTPRRPVVGKFEKFEVDVKFKASFASYFDPNELSIAATFTAPNGDRFVACGFLAGFSESEEESRPEWLIRFAPNQIGRWEYKVSVRNKIGEDISETLYFDCRQNESSRSVVKRGFVRRARSDSLYFEFDNGDFYYPIGQNVCWAARYDDFLAKMSSHGENWVRVWMCPWHLPLEEKDDAGNYDLAVAKKLDDLLSLAEKHGIYVQLVFEYHGMAASSGSWAENPYNQTNGGPCLAPGDFFEDAKARELFKRRLRYIAARWGYSTQVFAWELWNEVDLTEYREWDHVVAWHREMAGYLKAVDAQKHLVTTSCYKDEPGDALYALPQIDLAQAHRYTPQVTDFIVSVTQRVRKFNKPFFVAEFGRGWTPEVDQKDPTGAHLHAGLWSSFMTPAAGSAMLWWWDTFVEHNNLYPQWKALAAFAEGEDRRGQGFTLVTNQLNLPGKRKLTVQGLLSNSRGYFWFYDKAQTVEPRASQTAVPAGTTFALTGMFDGDYDVEFWDTYEGKVVKQAVVKATSGTLKVTMPEFVEDTACKIKFKGVAVPTFVPNAN